MNTLFDSNIITTTSQAISLIKLCEFNSDKKFKLIYRASRDGFGKEKFHAKCDNIPKTLSIIKVKNSPNIFGGYAECAWDSVSAWKQDYNSFIFSLINKENTPMKMKARDQYAILCHSDYHITFGLFSFQIATNSNASSESWSNLGKTFAHPTYQHDSNAAKTFLAGSHVFFTTEIEVYKVE